MLSYLYVDDKMTLKAPLVVIYWLKDVRNISDLFFIFVISVNLKYTCEC